MSSESRPSAKDEAQPSLPTKVEDRWDETVNWDVIERRSDGLWVQVRCRVCDSRYFARANSVRHRIARGTFRGLCRRHARALAGIGLARPFHPSVRWDDSGRPAATVTCPVCGERRQVPARRVRYLVKRGKFTGRCALHRAYRGPQPAREGP